MPVSAAPSALPAINRDTENGDSILFFLAGRMRRLLESRKKRILSLFIEWGNRRKQP
jgi:hypothetical protein